MKRHITQVSAYTIVGIICTGITWILWNILMIAAASLTTFDEKTVFSVTQWVSSITMIYPSFLAHKYITFAAHSLKSSAMKTTIKVYLVYIVAPLIASVCTYGIQSYTSLQDITMYTPFMHMNVGYILLQFFGLFLGAGINFIGQKYWVYHHSTYSLTEINGGDTI